MYLSLWKAFSLRPSYSLGGFVSTHGHLPFFLFVLVWFGIYGHWAQSFWRIFSLPFWSGLIRFPSWPPLIYSTTTFMYLVLSLRGNRSRSGHTNLDLPLLTVFYYLLLLYKEHDIMTHLLFKRILWSISSISFAYSSSSNKKMGFSSSQQTLCIYMHVRTVLSLPKVDLVSLMDI